MFWHLQAKFLFMVRDGRATVNSIISRKVTITGFDLTSYRQCMTKWNHAIETMHNQCKEIGSDKCMMVSSMIVDTWFDTQLIIRCVFFYCLFARVVAHFISILNLKRSTMNNWCYILKNGCEKF